MAWRRTLAALAATTAAGAGAAAWWAAPPCSNQGAGHPPPGPEHSRFLRRVGAAGQHVPPEENPGVRVFPDLLTEAEAAALLRELQPLKAAHGINLISPMAAAMYRYQMSYLGRDAPPVNMLRITGRPEQEGQRPPAWGYGDAFDPSGLPPMLARLAERIKALPGVRMGPLRDVTINYRRNHFYRLDPHLDPAGDGENVVIVSVDSGTVLTLCPQRWLQLQRAWDWVRSAVTMGDERDLIRRQTEGSWTDRDVDVRSDPRSAVMLSGDARWNWTHGTRLGVQVPGQTGLHDFWGRREDVLLRQPERHSVVFAFAAASGKRDDASDSRAGIGPKPGGGRVT